MEKLVKLLIKLLVDLVSAAILQWLIKLCSEWWDKRSHNATSPAI